MSNRRRNAWGNTYRTEYLHSRTWYRRRDAWFQETRTRGIPLVCAACRRPAVADRLELHHVDYHGVIRTDHGWVSRERHDDLIPVHPYCHELLHRLIERDRVLSRMRRRPDATRIALTRLQHKLAAAS